MNIARIGKTTLIYIQDSTIDYEWMKLIRIANGIVDIEVNALGFEDTIKIPALGLVIKDGWKMDLSETFQVMARIKNPLHNIIEDLTELGWIESDIFDR